MKKIQRTFAVALLGLAGFAHASLGADCVSVPPGAISWWRAEGNGTDFIGTNHGTLTGPVTFTNGMVGQGFLLDGSTGGIDLGNVPAFDFAPDSNFSFEAWFNSFGPSGGGNDGLVIVSLNYNCSPTLQSLTMANSTPAFGVVSFSVRDANGVLGFVSSPPVSSNAFHHAVGVREVLGTNKTLRLYLDGTLIGTTNDPTTGELALNVSDWIGRRNWCGTYNVFNGIIDEVAIYNRALTADEVAALFGAGAAGKCHGGYAINWFKVAGGGGSGTNNTYKLMGTVGQADAGGPHTNSQFSLVGGFWALPVAAQITGAPTLTIVPAAPGLATISWTPNTPGFVLQESLNLVPGNWTNSVSGATNPVTVPAVLPTKFYRLNKP